MQASVAVSMGLRALPKIRASGLSWHACVQYTGLVANGHLPKAKLVATEQNLHSSKSICLQSSMTCYCCSMT